jgi:Tfp pilus assembly protein PilO
MRLSEKQLLYVTLGVAGVVAIALAVLGIFVFQKNLSQARADLKGIEDKLNTANSQLPKKKALEDEIVKLEEDNKELQKQLPTKGEVAYEVFVDTLTGLSDSVNVILKTASISESGGGRGPAASVATDFEQISYDLKLEGKLFDLIKFISLLEEYPRFIKVSNFSFRPTKMGDALKTGEIPHELSVKITTYVNSGK